MFNSSSGYSLLTNPSSSDPITEQSWSTFEGLQEDSVSKEFKRTWSEKTFRRLGLKRIQEDLVSKDFRRFWSQDFRRTWSEKGHFSAEPLKHFRVVALQVGDAQTRISHLRFLLTSHTIQISESDHDCSMPTPRFSLVFRTPPSLHAQLLSYTGLEKYFASIKMNKEIFLLHLLSIHHASLVLVKGGK